MIKQAIIDRLRRVADGVETIEFTDIHGNVKTPVEKDDPEGTYCARVSYTFARMEAASLREVADYLEKMT